MELITIKNENGKQLVSARDLCEKLGITERFNSWFERMLKYGFLENEDYTGCKVFNTLARQEIDEYILSLDMAKQICMLQRSEIGTKFRMYFIECEKKLKQVNVPQTYAQALLEAGRLALENETLKHEIEFKEQIIKEAKPKLEYVDNILNSDNAVLITQIANDYNLSAIALNKILHQEKLIRKVDEQWILYNEHMNKGYTHSHTYKKKDKKGVEKCYIHTKWTQKGRLYIHSILESKGIKANMDKGE